MKNLKIDQTRKVLRGLKQRLIKLEPMTKVAKEVGVKRKLMQEKKVKQKKTKAATMKRVKIVREDKIAMAMMAKR